MSSDSWLTSHWRTDVTDRFSPFFIVTVGTFLFQQLYWSCFTIPYLLMEDYELFKHHKLSKTDIVDSEIRWSVYRQLLKDHCLQMLPLLMVSYPLLIFFGMTISAEDIPSWSYFLTQFIIFNILEDLLFYWIHRWFHTPWAFKNFHHKHHSYTEPYCLVNEIAHPIEFLFNFLLPIVAGPFLLGLTMEHGVHILTFWAWICFRELRGVDAHSGYHLPFHPLRVLAPIYGGPKDHELHHNIKGFSSNFGSYKFWDWLMGTDYKSVYKHRKR